MIQRNLNSSEITLQNHKKKTDLICREFEDLENKFERQNKIYETEIINKKQDNEKVNKIFENCIKFFSNT